MSAARLRLLRLREQNEAIAETMRHERKGFDALREREPVAAVSAPQLFQTPPQIVERMVKRFASMATNGGRFLEPSAGLGRLYLGAKHLSENWTLVEIAPQLCEHLYRIEGPRLIQDDFLQCDAERLGGTFDGVLMNPPFTRGTDIRHIMHAYDLLRPNAPLVALCYDGAHQNRKLRPFVMSWEKLPAGSFKTEGTRAGVVMITMRKKDE